MRAFCLVLSVCVSMSVYAGPKKKDKRAKTAAEVTAPAEPKTPDNEIPPGIADRNFQEEIKKADPFILAIINEHERQFPGAMGYDYLNFYAQLNRLSYIQQGLVFELMQTPGYLELFTNREPMTNFTVTVAEGEEVEARKFDDRAFKGLVAFALDRIKTAEDKIKGKGGAITAASVFERLRKTFYGSWNDSMYPRESDSVINHAIPLVLYGTLHQRNAESSHEELKALIAKLEIGAMDYFQDKLSWAPVFKDIEANIRFDKKYFKEDLDEMMDRTYRLLGKKIYGVDRKIVLRKGEVIHIREVHPDIAMFRGYVGNDCATCFSPGFVFNPMDRYYYVSDAEGKTLGYVGTTFVKVKGKKATLIHTIQGPGFNEATTQMVMRGFQAAQASLGSEITVLSGDRNIFENVNYYPIQKAMSQAVAGHKELAMKFEDEKFREIIAKWDSEMTYDDPKHNPYGREVNFPVNEVKVEVTQTPFDFNMSISSPEAIENAKKACELRMSWKSGRGGDDFDYYEW